MTDKEKLEEIKKLADAMYNRMQNLTTDTSGIRKAMDDYHQFIIFQYHKEESVSEEQVKESAKNQHVNETCKNSEDSLTQEPASEGLEEVADGYTRKVLERTNCLIENQSVGEEILKAVKFGAKWQKEQMIRNAVAGTIAWSYLYRDNDYGVIEQKPFNISERGLKEGDTVKLIIVKED